MMSLTSSVNRPVHTPLPSLGEEFFVTNTSQYEDSHSHPSQVRQVARLRRQGNASQQHPQQSHLLTGTSTPPQRGVFHSPQETLRSHPFVTIKSINMKKYATLAIVSGVVMSVLDALTWDRQ